MWKYLIEIFMFLEYIIFFLMIKIVRIINKFFYLIILMLFKFKNIKNKY